MKFSLILSLLALVFSCRTSQPLVNQQEIITPKIIFLNYKISKGIDDNVEITFINQIITDGKLKVDPSKKNSGQIGDIKCTQLDIDSLPLDSIYISNPLSKIIEYVNDSGQLEKKKIELDSAEFTVRTQLYINTEFITISQIGDSARVLSKNKL